MARLTLHTRSTWLLFGAFVFLASACASSNQSLQARDQYTNADPTSIPSQQSQAVSGPAPRHADFKVAVVADLNGRYGSTEYGSDVHRAVARLVDLQPDLVLSAGDMVAGQKEGLDYHGMWAGFHNAVTNPLTNASIPFAVSPGNHDASAYEPFWPEREVYAETWEAHKPDLDYIDDSAYPFRYAFKKEGVIFIALDITKTEPIDKTQRDWLKALLADTRVEDTIVVFGHIPLLPFAGGRHTKATLRDPELERLLNQHGVDLFLSGHHQVFYSGERNGMRLISNGCLGGGVRSLMDSEEPSFKTIVWLEFDKGSLYRVDAFTGRHFDELVPNEVLPESLGYEDKRMARASLGVIGLGQHFEANQALASNERPLLPRIEEPVDYPEEFAVRELPRVLDPELF